MEDPFGSVARPWHPALSQHYKLPPDVYYPFADEFLRDERYARWAAGHKPWQLHCFGGPGCGKTTFAAIVVEDLKRKYKNKDVHVASIFVRDSVSHDHGAFVEDFLALVYSQICRNEDPEMPAGCTVLPPEYNRLCWEGFANVDRINYIRSALHDALKENEHNYLILDGFDTLDEASQLLLDRELEDSRLQNMSLLVTRRLRSYQKEFKDKTCDGCDADQMVLYWECQMCPEGDRPQFCYECHEKQITCEEEGHALSLKEPYRHIDLHITGQRLRPQDTDTLRPTTVLDDFVAHMLEADDSGDCHPAEEVEPVPGSPKPTIGTVDKKRVHAVTDRSNGNINIAKLRLDETANAADLEDGEGEADRLPRSVIVFFDTEIERIRKQPLGEMALMAIMAVADCERALGLTMNELEQRTRTERTKSPYLSRHPIRALEDILCAANGLLVLVDFEFDGETLISCYNDVLKTYAAEDYNEHLYKARTKLDPAEPVDLGYESYEDEEAGEDDRTETVPSSVLTEEPIQVDEMRPPMLPHTDSGYYSAPPSRQSSADTDLTTLKSIRDEDEESGDRDPQQQNPDEVPELEIAPPDLGPEVEATGNGQPSKTTICTFCEEHILRSPVSHGVHFSSLEEFQKAASRSCIICAGLYDDILPPQVKSTLQAQTTESDPSLVAWPRYSWRVRSMGKARNGKPSITISFSPTKHSSESQTRKITSKRFHVIDDQDAGHVPDEETLGTSTDPTDPASGGEQLRDWIRICDEQHPHCYKYREGSFVPTRLLDLQCPDPDMVRVVETGPNNINTRYCTLSHSWGPPTFLQLTRSNNERLTGPGVRLAELTKNFQQAIRVARFIGLRYIWIDSLCIMQGKDGDFKSEGMKMHKVYRYSFCNIAIADSADSEGGLFRTRKPTDILPGVYECDGTGKLDIGTWRIFNAELWKEELLGTKIYTRGWVFQERMLSPRILHFAKKQIFWDCSTLSACEALPAGLPHALDTISATDRQWRGRLQVKEKEQVIGDADVSAERFWKSALLNYTSCNLTSQTDKTVAIWSIAKLLRDMLDEEYGAGMWQRAFHEQLAWRMKECGSSDARLPELQTSHPSWSWASVKGAVVAPNRINHDRCYTVTDHSGQPEILFEIKDYGDDRDSEPVLIEKPLALAGFMGKGVMKKDHGTGTYTLDVTTTGENPETAVLDNDPHGTFEAYLDDATDVDKRLDHRYEFIVLAATATKVDGYHLRDPTTEGPAETEEEQLATYSGTALLLESHKAYAYKQRAIYRSLVREVVKRNPAGFVRHPAFGHGKSLALRTEDMRKLVNKLRDRAKRDCGGIGIDKWYRRIGSMQFRGLGRKRWEYLMKDGRAKILLD